MFALCGEAGLAELPVATILSGTWLRRIFTSQRVFQGTLPIIVFRSPKCVRFSVGACEDRIIGSS
jgi:hypothetical protein